MTNPELRKEQEKEERRLRERDGAIREIKELIDWVDRYHDRVCRPPDLKLSEEAHAILDNLRMELHARLVRWGAL